MADERSTAIVPTAGVRRRAAPRRLARALAGPRTWLLLLLLASAVTLALAENDSRPLVLPLLALANIAAVYFAVLWARDKELPVFEIGSLWVAATLLYSALPFLGFLADGLRWSASSDGRFAQYGSDVDSVVSFAWRYVVYLASFVAVYLPLRARHTALGAPLDPVPRSMLAALLIMLWLQWTFEQLMYLAYGLDVNVSYTSLPATIQPAEMPYVLWQVTLIVLASVLVVKQALLLVLIRRWNDLRWRLLLVAWLAFEVGGGAVQMGARGTAIRLLLTFVVLYHRFVQPLRPLWLLTGGAVLLAGFLAQGILRFRPSLEDGLDLHTLLTNTNEFQSLFATAYDLFQRRLDGTLPEVPWQIYVSDLYLIIPSQLLPFYKWDPADWYLEVIGARGTGVGFMFGVMAQAVLGLDWIELVLRGALLGLLFALLHRWYVRRARRFWPTMLYLFVGIWSYYTFRATSFYLLHFVVYQFVSVMAVATLLNVALRRRRRTPGPA
jgi:hypothetical protein